MASVASISKRLYRQRRGLQKKCNAVSTRTGSSGIPSKWKRNKILLRFEILFCLVPRGFTLTALTKQGRPDRSMHWHHKPESIRMKGSHSSLCVLGQLMHVFCACRNTVTWNNKSLPGTWFLGLTVWWTS